MSASDDDPTGRLLIEVAKEDRGDPLRLFDSPASPSLSSSYAGLCPRISAGPLASKHFFTATRSGPQAVATARHAHSACSSLAHVSRARWGRGSRFRQWKYRSILIPAGVVSIASKGRSCAPEVASLGREGWFCKSFTRPFRPASISGGGTRCRSRHSTRMSRSSWHCCSRLIRWESEI